MLGIYLGLQISAEFKNSLTSKALSMQPKFESYLSQFVIFNMNLKKCIEGKKCSHSQTCGL